MSSTTTADESNSPTVPADQLEELFSAGGSSADQDFLESVLDHDISSRYLEHMEAEVARAHQLANRDAAEFNEFRQTVYKRTFEFLCQFPPRNSKMSGPFRALVYDDGGRRPLSMAEQREIMALEQWIISRATGGKNLAQQDIIQSVKQELTRHTDRRDASGGFWSRLFGGE